MEISYSSCWGELELKIRGGRKPPLPFRRLSRRSGRIPAEVAVGMPVAQHPPHRSPRANCPHEAPTLDEWRRTARVERDGARAEPESSAGQAVGTDPRSCGSFDCDAEAPAASTAQPVRGTF